MMILNSKAVSLLAGCVVIAGCDSGSSSRAPAPDVFEGSFVDSPVKGLYFETETQSGITDENGTFYYQADETVTFYLGATQLGRAPGSEVLTPFDISGHRPLDRETEILNAFNSSAATSYDRALNIANLLQQFDEDGDPENGIDLGDAHTSLSEQSIPLYVKAQSFTDTAAFRAAQDILDVEADRSFSEVLEHLYTSLNIEISSTQIEKTTTDIGAFHFDYDSEGRVISISSDTNNDGTPDHEQTFEYDDNGLLIQISAPLTSHTEALDYDENSNLISRIRSVDSVTESTESFSYSNGQLESFSFDLGGDGSTDRYTQLGYSEEGKLKSILLDVDGDLVEDRTAEISYQNALARSYNEDRDANGEADLSISYERDAAGNIVGQSTLLVDGEESNISRSSFTYDANNRPTRYELDSDQDGVAEYIEAYKYNHMGKRIEYKKDTDGDNQWDFVAQYSYDIDGNRTRMIEDSDGNGIVDKVWHADHQAALLRDPWEYLLEQL